ncbi:carbohydrate ABC transporter permease [Georgenia alba]|uniref:Carbohydrate ABC transporter permease n=1 Tax=Georgenia alba TaxID=2233858 RepID=A0ABW2Q613_9MICO
MRVRGATSRSRRAQLTGAAFVLPAMVLIAALQVYPLFRGALLSLQEWDGISFTPTFVGLENYHRLWGDEVFWRSMGNAFGFGAVGLLVGGALGLVMALAVNTDPRGARFFRAVFFLPWMLSPVVFGFLWDWLLDPAIGPVNELLAVIGSETWRHAWFGEPDTAFWAVAFVYVWSHWGFGFLLFLAGLQNIPSSVREAAMLDGAGAWARFRYVVWPLLRPVTVVVSVVSVLLALQIFGTVLVTTDGGPGFRTEVPTLRIYKESFENYEFGLGAAMSIVFGLVLVVLSVVQFVVARRSPDA